MLASLEPTLPGATGLTIDICALGVQTFIGGSAAQFLAGNPTKYPGDFDYYIESENPGIFIRELLHHLRGRGYEISVDPRILACHNQFKVILNKITHDITCIESINHLLQTQAIKQRACIVDCENQIILRLPYSSSCYESTALLQQSLEELAAGKRLTSVAQNTIIWGILQIRLIEMYHTDKKLTSPSL